MNNIVITKVKNGRGWFLDVEEVIAQAPLTSLELLTIGRMIENLKKELMEDLD